MADRAPPNGFSEWRRKGSDQRATFLTVAKGVGPDKGVDFAYFLAPDKAGVYQARVMRMELWWEHMEWVKENPDPYNLKETGNEPE